MCFVPGILRGVYHKWSYPAKAKSFRKKNILVEVFLENWFIEETDQQWQNTSQGISKASVCNQTLHNSNTQEPVISIPKRDFLGHSPN